MKRINIIIIVIVVVVLTVSVYLDAKFPWGFRVLEERYFLYLKGRILSAIVFFKEEDIEQKRKLILKYDEQDDWESLMQPAEEYLKLVPQDKKIWLFLAESYKRSDRLIDAERAVEKALELDAKFPWGLRLLAVIYRTKAEQSPQLKQKYLSKAQLKIEEALKIAPDDAYVNIEAAKVYLAQDTQDKKIKALKAVDKSLELKPEERYFLYFKGRILSAILSEKLNNKKRHSLILN